MHMTPYIVHRAIYYNIIDIYNAKRFHLIKSFPFQNGLLFCSRLIKENK